MPAARSVRLRQSRDGCQTMMRSAPVIVATNNARLTYVTNTFEQHERGSSNLVAAGFLLDEGAFLRGELVMQGETPAEPFVLPRGDQPIPVVDKPLEPSPVDEGS